MLLDNYIKFTDGDPTPGLFRLWAGLTMISGVAQRRVWINPGKRPIYPNIFALLVSPPGVGKSKAIERVRWFWVGAEIRVAPVDVNRASIFDIMGQTDENQDPWSSLNFATPEIGVLLNQHDEQLFATLCNLYDCDDEFTERRRHRDPQILVINQPHMTLIAGMPTGAAKMIFPEAAWLSGFASRVHIIYSADQSTRSIFTGERDDLDLQETIAQQLLVLKQISGEMDFTKEAIDAFQEWEEGGLLPVPTNTKMESYNTRRKVHALKISMLCALGKLEKTIDEDDIRQAIEFLTVAEVQADKAIVIMHRREGDILDQVLQNIGPRGVTQSEYYKFIQYYFRSNEHASAHLALMNSKRIRMDPGGMVFRVD